MPELFLPWIADASSNPVHKGEALASVIKAASWQERKRVDIHLLLMQAAQNRADDMAKNNYFGHTAPSGKTVNEFIREVGYHLPSWYPQKGNNCESIAIGPGTIQAAVEAWLNSPRHRDHITGSAEFYRGHGAIGAGMSVAQDGRLMWVFLSAPTE